MRPKDWVRKHVLQGGELAAQAGNGGNGGNGGADEDAVMTRRASSKSARERSEEADEMTRKARPRGNLLDGR